MTYTAHAEQSGRSTDVPRYSETLIVPVHRHARWMLPVGFLLVLIGLVIGLWRAELRLDAGESNRSPAWILWGGLGSSIALSTAIALVLWQRDVEQTQSRQHLAALESLHAITVHLSRNIRCPRTVLKELANSAQVLVGMENTGVMLFERQADLLRIVAAAGPQPGDAVDALPLKDLPLCRQCVETGRVLLFEDMNRWSGSVNRQVARQYKVGSLLLIPLEAGGERAGLLAMSCSQPRRFTASDRRLAELLGAQAAAILANSRLLEQTRSDADAKAMLLSELNHRVKNNLAAIIGLLSMAERERSEPTDRWKDRVIERVKAMADAHELFAGGSEVASLSDLVARMLPSLSMVGRGKVSTDVRLNVDVQLTPKTAIALGMALHELCFNALVHGLPDGGAITIRSRSIGPNRIAVDVQDNGCGLNGARATGGSGLGLKLVEGLVQRELRGTFKIGPADGGGTWGTIEFTPDALDVRGVDNGRTIEASSATGNGSSRENV